MERLGLAWHDEEKKNTRLIVGETLLVLMLTLMLKMGFVLSFLMNLMCNVGWWVGVRMCVHAKVRERCA